MPGILWKGTDQSQRGGSKVKWEKSVFQEGRNSGLGSPTESKPHRGKGEVGVVKEHHTVKGGLSLAKASLDSSCGRRWL
ncbi:hypothetical protein CRG98_025960 [Punica granatum]|uniref:Uncharacterized protein n=1 Tax=Punica granatum TaxID=22663 RepID=A0A2I0JBU5_PUNGR|nr:hypothetical protein CRG98_025960 [Punica granatum]